MFEQIVVDAKKLSDYWNQNKISSKKVRKDVEFNFFKNKKSQFSTRFVYFYALDNRIKQKYSNIFKRFFRHSAWKKDTHLLSRMKTFLSYPNSADAEQIVIDELQNFLNGEDCFDSNNKRNGKHLKNGRFKQDGKQKNQTVSKNNKIDVKNLKNNLNDLGYEQDEAENDSPEKDSVFEPNINDKNPEPLMDETELEFVTEHDAEKDEVQQTREHLEIEKESLTAFNNSKQNVFEVKTPELNPAKIVENNSPAPAVNEKVETKMQNISAPPSAQQDRKITPLSSTSTNSQERINITINQAKNTLQEQIKDTTQNINDKAKFFMTTNDKNPESLPDESFFRQQNHDDQDSSIIRDEIAKLSEQDIQDIKRVEEQQLEQQSQQAIQNREIEHLSINLQQAYKVSSVERSSSVKNSEVRPAQPNIQPNNQK